MPAEAKSIAIAYVTVTENAVIWSEQKGYAFYNRIWERYRNDKPAHIFTERSQSSVTAQVNKMLTECRFFSSACQRVLKVKPSGVSEEDILRMATALFNG